MIAVSGLRPRQCHIFTDNRVLLLNIGLCVLTDAEKAGLKINIGKTNRRGITSKQGRDRWDADRQCK